ncbi:MAG: hypothetical protein AAGI27_16575 [Pseudomonadota bacterium]
MKPFLQAERLRRVTRAGFRFSMLSIFSFVSTLGLTALFHEVFGIGQQLSFLATLILVFFLNFLGMRYYVSQTSDQPFINQFVGFLGTSLVFRGLEFLLFTVLLNFGLHYLVSVVLVQITGFVSKFTFYRFRIFNESR